MKSHYQEHSSRTSLSQKADKNSCSVLYDPVVTTQINHWKIEEKQNCFVICIGQNFPYNPLKMCFFLAKETAKNTVQKTSKEQKAKSTHLRMPCFNKVKFLWLFKKGFKSQTCKL